ncbi:hypothetical protein TNCV_1527631 [Trichonephila clavipes]|nr:hypothetical protein TNCV_1527631 [Trichonephila clavipes]
MKSVDIIVTYLVKRLVSDEEEKFQDSDAQEMARAPRVANSPRVAIQCDVNYFDLLKNILKERANKLGLGYSFRFQHDNDPKRTAQIVKLWLLYNVPNQLHTTPRSSDLNPAEHL